MKKAIFQFALFGTVALCAALTGCGGDPDPQDSVGLSNESIIGGSPATDYPEAALIEFQQNGTTLRCSGAVIAPQVVLTAGHCVVGGSQFQVAAPFANGQVANGTDATTFDYRIISPSVIADAHDVGLIFLDRPIQLTTYPPIATQPLPAGGRVVNVGRLDSGNLSNTGLFVGRPVAVSSGLDAGFPFDYQTELVIEHGDSGGPAMIEGTHTIAAVNSGILGNGTQVLARVDLVAGFIAEQIDLHGGGGTPSPDGPGPGTPPPPPSQPPSQPPPPPPPPPNPGGEGGDRCYALACDGRAFQQCFPSEAQYCSALCSSPACPQQAQFFCSVFCG